MGHRGSTPDFFFGHLASMSKLPWVCMGDFNEVISEEEKSGGNHISQRRVRAIQD